MRTAVILLFLASGSVSLHDRVYENVSPGDGWMDVKKALGAPRNIVAISDHEGFAIYKNNAEICAIRVDHGVVLGYECADNPDKLTALGAIGMTLGGAGQALMHARDRAPNCTDVSDSAQCH